MLHVGWEEKNYDFLVTMVEEHPNDVKLIFLCLTISFHLYVHTSGYMYTYIYIHPHTSYIKRYIRTYTTCIIQNFIHEFFGFFFAKCNEISLLAEIWWVVFLVWYERRMLRRMVLYCGVNRKRNEIQIARLTQAIRN